MNSIAIIIILMISLVGIGSLFWMRQYYNPQSRQIDKKQLIASITNILSNNNDATPTTPTIRTGNLYDDMPEETEYTDAFTKISNETKAIKDNIQGIFTKNTNKESKRDSLKTAIQDTINTNNKQTNTLEINTPNKPKQKEDIIYPEHTLTQTQEKAKTNINTLKTALENTKETTEEETEKIIEPLVKKEEKESTTPFGNDLNNTTIEVEHEPQEKEEKTPDIITPLQTKQNKELLELYEENETITPYEDFDFKNTDQKRIENASNKIDKFYEKLSEISLNKLTNKTKETYNEGTQKIQNTLRNEDQQTDKQTRFNTNNIENETVVTFNPEPQMPISPTPQAEINPTPEKTTTRPRNNTPIKANIGNRMISLKRGDSVIFNHNGETYSSIILDVRVGEVYVNYRRQRIWIKTDSIKKKFD